MIKQILILSLLVFAGNAYAVDWFFRPFISNSFCQTNVCDGTSYETAWRLDDTQIGLRPGAVDWSKLSPGDTLFVCGTHDVGFRDRALKPTISGTDDDPITIDGACPNDSGLLFSVGRRLTGGWSCPDEFGAYSQPYGGNTQAQAIEDGVTRLIRETKLPDETWKPGSFFQAGTSAPLYYKPSNGIATDHVVYGSGSTALDIANVNSIHVKNLALQNSSVNLVEIHSAQDIRIDNSTLRWALTAIEIKFNSNDGVIFGNVIRDVGNGIYFRSDNTDASSNDGWTVARNKIHGVNPNFYYNTKDSHAIGIQLGNDNVFVDNELFNIGGSGLTFFIGLQKTQKNNTVKRNFIHDVNACAMCPTIASGDLSGQREIGIEYQNSNDDDPEKTSGNIIADNIVVDVGRIGIKLKSAKRDTGFTWTVRGNTIMDAEWSFAWDEFPVGDPGFLFHDNISINPGSRHITLDKTFRSTDNHAGIVMFNNKYHPDGDLFNWANIVSDFNEWQTRSGKGQNSEILP